jgi:RecA-family ATPase
MRDGDEYGSSDDALLRERLFIVSRVSVDNLLTTTVNGMLVRTDITERIVVTAEQISALKLVVLDPVSRFRGGDENSNEGATRFVEAIEAIRAATGASILLPHHVSKDGLRAGAERLSIENLRGASALADAVRWAAAMATLRKDAAEDYGVDPEDSARYVRLDVVKNNYGAPWPGMWLKREFGGVLVPTTLELKRRTRDEHKAQDRYLEVLPKLQGLIRQNQEKGEPLTRNRLRDFSGKAGLFGVGDQTLRGIVERALAEGHISEHDTGDRRRGKELRTWR